MFTKKVRAVIARQAETKSVRSTVVEQEITPAFNLLVRGYLTGVQNFPSGRCYQRTYW